MAGCKRWLIVQTTACLSAVALSEVLGINRSTLVSLSAFSIAFCASTLLPLGIVPAVCSYFGRHPGLEPAAFKLKRERPLAWGLLGIAIAMLVGGVTFGAGLYFASLGAQRHPSAIECLTARVIGIQEIQPSVRKLWRCRRWARVQLSTGEIVRPCLDSDEWSQDLPTSAAVRHEPVRVLINRNMLGSSVNQVLSIRQAARLSSCPSLPQGAESN